MRNILLLCSLILIFGRTISADQFEPKFNLSLVVPDMHVVDLNVSVSYELSRVGAHAFLSVSVSVPYIDSKSSIGGQQFCPSVYLIDFVDPLRDGNHTLSYLADVDKLGKARSPCAVLNFTYDRNFSFPDEDVVREQYYGGVQMGWNVSFSNSQAIYTTAKAFNLTSMTRQCGVSSFESLEPVYMRSQGGISIGHYVSKRNEWTLRTCQVGYYGKSCSSSVSEYAASCVSNEASATMSSTAISLATNAFGQARPMFGDMNFSSFIASSKGCQAQHARGIVTFDVVVDSFDPMLLVRYLNSPFTYLSNANIVGVLPETAEGLYLYDLTVTPDKRNMWKLSIATRCAPFTNTTYSTLFAVTTTPLGYVAQFTFNFQMQLGNSLVMQVVQSPEDFTSNLTFKVARLAVNVTMLDNVTEWQKERVFDAIVLASGLPASNVVITESFTNTFTLGFQSNETLNISLLRYTLSLDLLVPEPLIDVVLRNVTASTAGKRRLAQDTPQEVFFIADVSVRNEQNFTQALSVKSILKAVAVNLTEAAKATSLAFFKKPPEIFGDGYKNVDISLDITIITPSDDVTALLTENATFIESTLESNVEQLDGVLSVPYYFPPSPLSPAPPFTPYAPPPLPQPPAPNAPTYPLPPSAPTSQASPTKKPQDWTWAVPATLIVTVSVAFVCSVFV